MNPINKKASPATGKSQRLSWPPGQARQIKPVVAQLKTAVTPQGVKRPVAPPVYRPQPVPKVLQKKVSPVQNTHAQHHPINQRQTKSVLAQAKLAGPSQIKSPPVAPPVYRPQPKPNAARTHSAVQRYSEVKVAGLGIGKMSENDNYFIPRNDAGAVYVKAAAATPRSSIAQKDVKTYKSKNYHEYRSKEFINDCLHTAEEINAEKELKRGVTRSRVPGQRWLFGGKEERNIWVANKFASDDAADPQEGQAYVIVNTKWPGGVKYPYHAAAVVAVDGKDRITLEVCATDEDAVMRDTNGTYNMYETGSGSSKTFHTHWKNAFFKDDSATLVIEPK